MQSPTHRTDRRPDIQDDRKGSIALLANNAGFAERLSQEFRVAAIGTSLTAHGGWLAPLQDALSLTRGQPVRATAFAKPGATSAWGLAQADAVIAFQPSLILIELAVNDAALHRPVRLGRSAHNLGRLLDALKHGAPQAPIFVMAMNPLHGLRNLVRPRLDSYVEAHRNIALAASAGFIDHRPAWLSHSAYELRKMIPDGAHPIPACAVALMLPRLMERLAVIPPSAKKPEHVR